MALVSSTLKLADVFDFNNKGPQVTGRRLADHYYDYAQGAQSCAGTPAPPAIAAAHLALRTSLTLVFATQHPNPAVFASKIALAFSSFWLAPPIAFLGTSPGLVTLAVPTPLQVAILAILTENIAMSQNGRSPSIVDLARKWESALDIFTHSVVVAHGAPTPCILPLT